MTLFTPKKLVAKSAPKRTIKLAYEFKEIFGFEPPLDKFMMSLTGQFELNLFELDRKINFCAESLRDCVARKYGQKAVEHIERWLV